MNNNLESTETPIVRPLITNYIKCDKKISFLMSTESYFTVAYAAYGGPVLCAPEQCFMQTPMGVHHLPLEPPA